MLSGTGSSLHPPDIVDRGKASTCHRYRRSSKRKGRKVTVGECSKLHRHQSNVVFPSILGPWVAFYTVQFLLYNVQQCTLYSIQLANPSLSQRSFHQRMVTRLPNHWCASSCATTTATHCCALELVSPLLYSRDVSL